MNNKIMMLLGGVTLLLIGVWWLSSSNQSEEYVQEPETNTDDVSEEVEEVTTDDDVLIKIDAPIPNASVASPVVVSGEARGYWYFEAVAPVEVRDNTNAVIGSGFVTAQGDWMTENFVPFTGSITYTLPSGVSGPVAGSLVFKRDNPSGLPENDASVSIPVTLQ